MFDRRTTSDGWMVTSARSARREAGSGRRGRPRRSAPRRWRCGGHGPQHGSGKPVERAGDVDDQQEAGHRNAVVALSAAARTGALSPSDTAGSSALRHSGSGCRSRPEAGASDRRSRPGKLVKRRPPCSPQEARRGSSTVSSASVRLKPPAADDDSARDSVGRVSLIS